MLLSPFPPAPRSPRKLSPRTINIEKELKAGRELEDCHKNIDQTKDITLVGKFHTPLEIYKPLADNEKNAEMQYRTAEILITSGKLTEGLYYMKLAAAQKHTMAQCRLGEMYAYGYGVRKDVSTAITWFDLAESDLSDHSCPRALMHLGVIYCEGLDTPTDWKKGSAYLLQAERSYKARAEHFSTDCSLIQETSSFGIDVGEDSYYLKPAEILPKALFQLSKKYAAMNQLETAEHYFQRAIEAGYIVQHDVSLAGSFELKDVNDFVGL